jgi:hypothetical protein
MGPQGIPAALNDFPRIAYANANVQFDGDRPAPVEAASITITAPGNSGNLALIKIDVAVRGLTDDGSPLNVYLTRDGSNEQSLVQSFTPAPFSGGPASITWVVQVPAGTSQIFRLWIGHQQRPANCREFNSCSRRNVYVAMSAIASPFAADGSRITP